MVEIRVTPGAEPVKTTDPVVSIAPLPRPGTYVFTVVVADEQGLLGEASWQVVVKPG